LESPRRPGRREKRIPAEECGEGMAAEAEVRKKEKGQREKFHERATGGRGPREEEEEGGKRQRDEQ